MILLKCSDISKKYGNNLILDNINLTVNEGDFISIIGKSGSGKSTLLDIINDLTKPTTGTVNINCKTSTVFQNYQKSLFPFLNVLQNVKLPFKEKSTQSKKKSIEYIKLVGLQNDIYKLPKELSGGMQQRVALARALAQEPKLLLLDEPFGSIDSFTKRKLSQDLLDLRERLNLTIILVTHNVDEAIFLSNKILYLNEINKGFEKTIDISIPYPRDIVATLTSVEFNNYKKKILSYYQ